MTTITGSTPAGKALRTAVVTRTDNGDVRLAIYSAQGNFMANIRLSTAEARDLAAALRNEATSLASARSEVTP